MKTSSKRKAISKKPISEEEMKNFKEDFMNGESDVSTDFLKGYDEGAKDQAKIFSKTYKIDEVGVDNATDIDVPLHLRGGEWTWNFQKKMSLVDKITWVLTAVNVAILISLIIKNI